jgi:hypothetical protein
MARQGTVEHHPAEAAICRGGHPHGVVWFGEVRPRLAGSGSVRRGPARNGWARLGEAWLGGPDNGSPLFLDDVARDLLACKNRRHGPPGQYAPVPGLHMTPFC